LVGFGVRGGSDVAVGGTDVAVGGTGVGVGGTGVGVGRAVFVGGTDVLVAIGPDVAVCPGAVVGTAVAVRVAWVGVLSPGALVADGAVLGLDV
jgi:hypothetical protein